MNVNNSLIGCSRQRAFSMITPKEIDQNEEVSKAFRKARSRFYNLIEILAKLRLPNVYDPSEFTRSRADFTYKYFTHVD